MKKLSRQKVRAWCPNCGDRLFTVYYVAPRNIKTHIQKTNFLVCRACPRFFVVNITELPIGILPPEQRKIIGVYGQKKMEEMERVQIMGLERAKSQRNDRGRFIEVED